jgi:hypothetical protein
MNFIKNIVSRPKSGRSDELILEYWEVYITEGMSAAMHNEFTKIIEVYIPELKLVINQQGNPINVFILDYDRYSGKTINMSGKNPKLIKTVKLNTISESAQKLIWLADVYMNKKEKEKSLVELFVD